MPSWSLKPRLKTDILLLCLCATRPRLSRGSPPDKKLGARTGNVPWLFKRPARADGRVPRSALSKSSTLAAFGEASGSGGANEKVVERFSLCEARTSSLQPYFSRSDRPLVFIGHTFVVGVVDEKSPRCFPDETAQGVGLLNVL